MAGARDHTELIVWQLANELCLRVFALTACGGWARDFKLRSQTDDAASSVRRNIGEGFGRRSHPEFARFLEISRSSLNELPDCLLEAEQKGYATTAQLAEPRNLIKRSTVANARFTRYLLNTPTPRPPGPNPKRPPVRRGVDTTDESQDAIIPSRSQAPPSERSRDSAERATPLASTMLEITAP
jgi:four helix bundle protein